MKSRAPRGMIGAMKSAPLFLLALLLAPQDKPVLVGRLERSSFLNFVAACREAREMTASDPQGAVDKLGAVISHKDCKPDRSECRVRIADTSGGYDDPVDFYPWQLRGLAYQSLAKKEPANAVKHLAAAVEDLKYSFETRKVAASEALLAEAKRLLEDAKRAAAPKPGPADDPLKKLNALVDEHLNRDRYKAARDEVQADTRVAENEKAELLRRIQELHSSYLSRELGAFLRDFRGSWTDLSELTEGERRSRFRLPPGEQLLNSTPALDWARKHRELLVGIDKAEPAKLLAAAFEAAAIESPGAPNSWFQQSAYLAAGALQSSIKGCVDRAASAPRDERLKLSGLGARSAALWKDFAAKLDPKVREAHASDLDDWGGRIERLASSFPVDLADLDAIDLDSCFGPEADAKFDEIDRRLRELSKKSGLSRESRQRLVTMHALAVALRSLAAGRSEDEALDALRKADLDRKLAEVGDFGPEAKRYGPRVERVLAGLR